MISVRKASAEDIDMLMALRLEMLRTVNALEVNAEFDDAFTSEIREYFLNGNQTTVIAFDGETAGCASICYVDLMPTFDHPTGRRAHIMNVYTRECFRRKGIASRMMKMLIDEAREKGVTEISLDATESGRPLYESLGFRNTTEGMVLDRF